MKIVASDDQQAKALLRQHLDAALALADQINCLAAVHIATAIDAIDAHAPEPAQSSER